MLLSDGLFGLLPALAKFDEDLEDGRDRLFRRPLARLDGHGLLLLRLLRRRSLWLLQRLVFVSIPPGEVEVQDVIQAGRRPQYLLICLRLVVLVVDRLPYHVYLLGRFGRIQRQAHHRKLLSDVVWPLSRDFLQLGRLELR